MRLAPTQASTLLIALLVALPLGMAQVADDGPVREIDALTLQWTGLAHQKDTLQANWRTERPVLEQQLALLEREARALDEFLAASAEQHSEVDQKRLELLEEQTRLEQEQAELDRSLVQAALKLNSLHRELPPPLVDAWAEDLPRLDDPLLTASEKLQLVVELSGQLNDFERKLTLNEAVMTMADGREYAVKQVYLGLSHGWYVTGDQQFAAEGKAGPDGWQWKAVDAAGPITEIVGILEGRIDPALVSIPVELDAPAARGN
jgi:hypothetical protein